MIMFVFLEQVSKIIKREVHIIIDMMQKLHSFDHFFISNIREASLQRSNQLRYHVVQKNYIENIADSQALFCDDRCYRNSVKK